MIPLLQPFLPGYPPGTHTRLSDELCAVALTQEEVQLAKALLGRVEKLAAAAVGTNVKLMIDAEHTYFQPVRNVVVLCKAAAVLLCCVSTSTRYAPALASVEQSLHLRHGP